MIHTAPNSCRNQRGFTLIEIMIVMVILAILGGIVLVNTGIVGSGAKAKKISQDIALIVTAARGWKGLTKPYTGVSIQVLTSMDKLPAYFGTGVGVNSEGGNYTVAGSTAPTTMVVTVTGLANSLCLNVQNTIVTSTVGGTSATCTTGTLRATFD